MILEGEPSSHLSDPRTHAVQTIRRHRSKARIADRGIRSGKAVPIEGVKHREPQTEFATLADVQRLIDSNILDSRSRIAKVREIAWGVAERTVIRIGKTRGIEVRPSDLSIEVRADVAVGDDVGVHIVDTGCQVFAVIRIGVPAL